MGAAPDGRNRNRLVAWRRRAVLPLCLLLGCLAPLVGAPGALAAGSGSISGKVTSASSHSGLSGIEVVVFEAATERPTAFATTEPDGRYTAGSLPGGEYKVKFSQGRESGNYAFQYYADASTYATAQTVLVTEASVTPEINAELQAGAEIKGTVLEATTSEDIVPLHEIEVTVYEANDQFPVGFASTNSQGEYTVEGLAGGFYKVEFSAGGGFGLIGEGEEPGEELPAQDFITQFYKGQPSFATATPVEVLAEQVKAGVNAELQRGAEIEGTVTNASTHEPVEGAYVEALGTGETEVGFAFTNASGHYVIVGLPTGSYKLKIAGYHYFTQYYDNQPTPAAANTLSVLAPHVTAGINVALVPWSPVNTAAPVVSGSPSLGQTLTCAPGSWSGKITPTYTYVWLRDGVTIPGAVSNTYVVQSADQGNGLTCKVTALNKYGSAAALSNTLTVPIPSPPPLTPTVTIDRSKIVVRGDVVRVPISCGAGANCTGWVELLERVTVKHRHGHHSRNSTKNIVVGKATYTLAGGHETTVVIRLSHSAAHALAHAKHHSLDLTAHAVVGGGSTANRPLLLSLAVSRPAHKNRQR